MVADQNPSVGLDLAGQGGDDVPDGGDFVGMKGGEADLDGTRARVIGEGQAALPAGGDVWTAEGFEDGLGGGVGEGERGDGGEVFIVASSR